MQTMGNEAKKTHCLHKELHVSMGNEARKTHCSYKELQCKHWVMKLGRLIVHTTSYNVTMGNEARKTHCLHKELQFNNG
ncbi:hypothetical protein KSS87_023943 [Heliosperma pusillum]|nr:hypothetical protein KSS87_023943 [Heliosperma pusillum]KAH9608020.1 hypothetical protein KSS87_023943 [Heliosperma pusillum]